MKKSLTIGLILVFLSVASCATTIYDGITLKKVTRTVDLTTQFSRQTSTITLTNTGSKATSELFLAFEAQLAQHLSLVDVNDQSGALLKTQKADTQTGKGKSFVLYRVELGQSLAPQASIDLRVYAVFTHTMTPFPTEITQYEKQLVRYHDNHFFSSPYLVQTQTTNVKLPTSHIEKNSEENPTSVKGDTITYGPYDDTQAFSHSDMTLHFENNSPFITVTRLVKEIEISHWGNVAVEETYTLQHDGARLKGAFSRYDYQRSQGHAPAHVPIMKQFLPIGAADVYYRDEIGNISTSHFSESDGVLELIPRFPLFGGWKYGYYMGYNLPAQDYLNTDAQNSNHYVLNITFATGLQSVAIDELVVRIIFPEGASGIEHFTPFPIDGSSTDTHFTYLDTTGRPVLVLTKKNVVAEHNRPFQATYNFSQTSLLQEPFLLIVAFFLFFLFIMIYVRIEFSIGPSKLRRPNADKIDDVLLRVRDLLNERESIHESLDDALNKALRSKDVNDYNTKRSKLEVNLSNARSKFLKAINEMEEMDGELTRKLRDIERKEEEKTFNQQQLHEVEIGHKIKRTARGDYDSAKAKFEKLYSVAEEELAGLTNDVIEDL